MAINPLLEAYLASTRSRQPNMAMTEIDSLFNPYTYMAMNNQPQASPLETVDTSSDSETFSFMPDSAPMNQQVINQQPIVNIDPSPTQPGNFEQFQSNIKDNVYNPITNEFEPTTYLLDSIAPNYSQKITDFMTGATPDMSQAQLDAIEANVKNVQAETLSNPVRAGIEMQESLPDIAGAMGRSGAEQEEFERKQADAQRRADQFDAFIQRERTRNLEDSLGLERGSRGGQPTAFEPGGVFDFFTGGGGQPNVGSAGQDNIGGVSSPAPDIGGGGFSIFNF